MKYFLDTEFIEDGRTIDLLSIGMVAEDGRELYAEVDQSDVDHEKADQWVKDNVIAHLWHKQKDKTEFNGWTRDGGVGGLLYRKDLAPTVLRFCDPAQYGKPEFWAYYADYDWVVLCQLFGRMVDLPKDFPKYCNDLKQLCVNLDNPPLPKNEGGHHALADARWVRDRYRDLLFTECMTAAIPPTSEQILTLHWHIGKGRFLTQEEFAEWNRESERLRSERTTQTR